MTEKRNNPSSAVSLPVESWRTAGLKKGWSTREKRAAEGRHSKHCTADPRQRGRSTRKHYSKNPVGSQRAKTYTFISNVVTHIV